MSIWLALGFSVFWRFICVPGIGQNAVCEKTGGAGRGERTVLPVFEYEPHLLKEYSLFALDTSFRSGTENMDEICAHLWKFTELNTVDAEGKTQEGLALQGVSVKDPVRLTDGQGAVFTVRQCR